MIEDLEHLVGSAVTEVMTTMMSFRVQPTPNTINFASGEGHVASAVGFIGKTTGVIYLYASDTFARQMTCRLLGLEDSDIDGDEMVNDAMGELANMVVGHIKSRLVDRGLACVLTIPSIIRGSSFSIEPVSSAERRVYFFDCDQSRLGVEVMLKHS
jgi:chemotaxis protein CheX